MPGLLFWLYLPQHLLVNAMTTLVYAIHGQGRAALRGKRDALRALPRVLGERRQIQAARVASTGDLRSAMARGGSAYAFSFRSRFRRRRPRVVEPQSGPVSTPDRVAAAGATPFRGMLSAEPGADPPCMAPSSSDACSLGTPRPHHRRRRLRRRQPRRRPRRAPSRLGDRRARQPAPARLGAQPAAAARGGGRASSTATCASPTTCWRSTRSTRSSSARPSRRCWRASTATPSTRVHTNLLGAYHCLELARRDAAQFVFLSTSRVYPVGGAGGARATTRRETRFELAGRQAVARRVRRRHLRGLPARRRAHALRRDQARRRAADRGVRRRRSGCRAVIDRCGVIAGPWQMGKVDQGVFTYWMLAHHFGRPLALHRLRRHGQAGPRPAPRRRPGRPGRRPARATPTRWDGRDGQRRRRPRVQPLAARDDRALPRAHRQRGRRSCPAPGDRGRATCPIYLSDCARLFERYRAGARGGRRSRRSPTSSTWIARARDAEVTRLDPARRELMPRRDRHRLRRA